MNVLACRLVFNQDVVWQRSRCPRCSVVLLWYDLIPIVSWCVLRGACRHCHKPISLLYPCIELLSVCLFSLLFFTVPSHYFFAYFIFFSALLVTIRSDIETMLISRFVTVYLIPVGIAFSAVGLLPIDLIGSIGGTFFGYGFLFSVSRLFFFMTKKEGMGDGDLELLAFIGSFIGIVGCWISLMIGAILGSLVGISYLLIMRAGLAVKIPFGPFLAAGAIVYVVFQESIFNIIMHF